MRDRGFAYETWKKSDIRCVGEVRSHVSGCTLIKISSSKLQELEGNKFELRRSFHTQ